MFSLFCCFLCLLLFLTLAFRIQQVEERPETPEDLGRIESNVVKAQQLSEELLKDLQQIEQRLASLTALGLQTDDEIFNKYWASFAWPMHIQAAAQMLVLRKDRKR